MATREALAPVDERDLYPLHEEDDVPEIPFHEKQVRLLRDAIEARDPDWFVTGNVCVYWEEGNTSLYRAPDVLVVQRPVETDNPRVYLLWRDPPITFAAEIGSRSTFRVDEGPKLEIYAQHIRAREYLYSDPPRGDQRLWRLCPGGYEAVAPEANGRLRSMELNLEFEIVDGFLRVFTLDGDRLRTHEESEFQLRETQTLVGQERRRAQDAEARAEDAEARAEAESRQRQEAEERLRELERQLEALHGQQASGD